MNSSLRVMVCVCLIAAFSFLTHSTSSADSHDLLRSAYLGPSAWSDNLSSAAVKTQLQEHFTEVIKRLEANQTRSLLQSLHRAELASTQPWTKSERLAVLRFLSVKRQQQIHRLRYYRDRGLFPVNEGHAHHAVPIFVDRNQTHCAVGYLMHSDGDDAGVREIVEANNLVYVNDVHAGSLVDWIRTSGLTREEAAMIQPAYPIFLDATFEYLSDKGAVVEREGFVLSEATLRGFRFFADGIPDSFEENPEAIDGILEQGKELLKTNDIVNSSLRSNTGVLFGIGPCDEFCSYMSTPSPLPWLYIGSSDAMFNGFVGSANANGDTGIAEIKYTLRSESGEPLTEFALTILNDFYTNTIVGEQSALLVRSEIFDGYTDEKLAGLQLFQPGLSSLTNLHGSEQISFGTDFIRVTTYGLVVGGNNGDTAAPFHHYFHELQHGFDLGDVNQDGIVNLLDVTPFVELLVAGEFQTEADINQDGAVDLLDVALFVDLLGN